MKGVIPDLSDLEVSSPEKLIEDYGIDLRRNNEVVAVDIDDRTVHVDSPNALLARVR